MRRVLSALAVAMLLASPSAAQASGGIVVRHVDLAKFPLVRVTVVAPAGSRPILLEGDQPASFASSQELGSSEALVLAVDNSESMQGAPLRQAKIAAGNFLAGERGAGTAGLVVFGHEALALSRAGETKADVEQTLSAISADTQTGTSLYDAVVTSVARLERMSNGTRILVLLTDGRDVGSRSSERDAVTAVQRGNVIVYAIAVGVRADRTPLWDLANATGGRVFGAAGITDLSSAYAALGRELDHTWQLSFLARARLGDRMKLRVLAGAAQTETVVPIPKPRDHNILDLIPASIARKGGTAAGAVLLAALLLGAAGAIANRRRQKSEVTRLLHSHLERRRAAGEGAGRRRAQRLDALLSWTESSMAELPGTPRLEKAVQSSGLKLRLGHVPYISGVCALLFGIFGAFAGVGSLLTLALMILGALSPLPALRIAANRRRQAFDRQLPDVLATVASTLRAGHGLRSALRAVAEDGAAPASEEFARALGEERLGRPLDQAVSAICERIGSTDLEYVATAINVQSQAGGSLATLFDTLSETVRERQRHARKVRALTSMGRMSATVLICLPFGLVALMTLISPAYMKPFFTTSTGHVLIAFCLTSMAIGAVILKRIVDVRY